jgi:SAM-dependent methyltransferase
MTQENRARPSFDFDAVFEVDDYLYFYSEMLTDDLAERQVDFLIKELELTEPMDILDLACGFGRHANRLAALGHRVTGIDLMPGFIELARRDADARGVLVDYRQGDMRKLDFDRQFDRLLLLFTAFGYFEDEENYQVLVNIARALRPGGLMILDSHNRDTFMKGFLPYIVTEKGNDLMIDRNSFDTLTGREYNRRIVIRNGVRKDKPFFVRLYSPNEIAALLEKAGMETVKMFGGWDGAPLTSEGRRMIVIARKAG